MKYLASRVEFADRKMHQGIRLGRFDSLEHYVLEIRRCRKGKGTCVTNLTREGQWLGPQSMTRNDLSPSLQIVVLPKFYQHSISTSRQAKIWKLERGGDVVDKGYQPTKIITQLAAAKSSWIRTMQPAEARCRASCIFMNFQATLSFESFFCFI